MDIAKEIIKIAKDSRKCQHCINRVVKDSRFCYVHLVEHKAHKGREWAEILNLRTDTIHNRGKTPEDKDFRYKTTWGNKTALGVYLMIVRFNEERGEQ